VELGTNAAAAADDDDDATEVRNTNWRSHRWLMLQIDEMIQSAERQYSAAELPLEPTKAEMMLREHEASRSKVKSMLDCTADEGEEIVVRVRQQVGYVLAE